MDWLAVHIHERTDNTGSNELRTMHLIVEIDFDNKKATVINIDVGGAVDPSFTTQQKDAITIDIDDETIASIRESYANRQAFEDMMFDLWKEENKATR